MLFSITAQVLFFKKQQDQNNTFLPSMLLNHERTHRMDIFLVGGAVRDTLLNYPFSEKDWLVTGASPEQLISKGYTPVGKDFPVFLHPSTHEEYALARTERKTAPGYKGFSFHTSPDVTIEQDLARRDLTINAIAQSTNGDIIDPYDGKKDLQECRLRHVSPAFSEDPVRILRVARFLARYHHLGFTIAPETIKLMQNMVQEGETKYLVPERMWQECHKALSEQHPDMFLHALIEIGAVNDVFSEITADLHSACQEQLKKIAKKTEKPIFRFISLCFPLDIKTTNALCQSLTVPKEYNGMAVIIQQHYNRYSDCHTYLSNTHSKKSLKLSKHTESIQALFTQTDAIRKERYRLLEHFIQNTCHNL